MKHTIKLRETELKRMIAESVNKMLNEVEFQGVRLDGKNPEDWEALGTVRDDLANIAYDDWRDGEGDEETFMKHIRGRNKNNANFYDMTDNDNVVQHIRNGSKKAKTISKNLGLYETIYKAVRKALNEGGMDAFERASQMHQIVTPEGIITLNHASYLKWKRDQKKKNAGTRRRKTEPTINTGDELDPNQLHAKIEKLIKSAAPLESLYTFKEHAYRSYGNVAKEMMKPFAEEYRMFSIAYRKINESLKKIEEYGRANEYETYNEARTLTYNIEEMQIALVNLCDAVKRRRKEIKMKYGDTAAFNGRADKKNPKLKKELGFVDQLFSKSAKVIDTTISNLQSAAEEIASIADKGRNPLSYNINENNSLLNRD